MAIRIEPAVAGQTAACEAILRSLPQWFGIEDALANYVRDVASMPTFLAIDGGEIAGFVTIRLHNPHSAEIQVMAVRPESHRKSIGKALVDYAESWASSRGVEYLHVKTLGPSRRNAHYERTRAFYLAMGFKPLEEFENLWGAGLPCLAMIKTLG